MQKYTSYDYLKDQFKKLKKTKYGYSVKIFDGYGNHTNQMELTIGRAKEILKILQNESE
tara:strand:+ start:357 stop:533 length:177 start_codon:yes stop_codon:yes gene_type:complete